MKRADGTALSVIVVMFDHHKSLRNHRDTRTLEQYAIFYHAPSLCATRDAQAHSERQRARERTKVPSKSARRERS